MSASVKCRGCDDIRSTSCGAVDCPVPLQASGDLDSPPTTTNDDSFERAARGVMRRRIEERIPADEPVPPRSIEDLAVDIAAIGQTVGSCVIRRDLAIKGTWRIYFHRLNPDGMPWNVAPDHPHRGTNPRERTW